MKDAGPRSILTAGFIAMDAIQHRQQVAHRAGGTAANVAANLAFLGWHSSVAGCIGDDRPGRTVRRDLGRVGVETRFLRAAPDTSTPVVIHEIPESGRHRFLFRCPRCNRQSPKFRPMSPEYAGSVLAEGDAPAVFFFDRASRSTVAMAQRYRAEERLVVFEPSMPGTVQAFRDAVRASHLVKYSDEQGWRFRELFDEDLDLFRIVTSGPDGATVLGPGGEKRHVPGFPARVVDAAGAGDWTTAGLLHALGESVPSMLSVEILAEALKFGQRLGAANCGFLGARGLSEALDREAVLALVERLETVLDPTLSSAPPLEREATSDDVCSTCYG